MADTHMINGRHTSIGHAVHYTDHSGEKHAAILKKIKAPEENSARTHVAHLHVFHKHNGSTRHEEDVPHSIQGMPHSWQHIS